MAVLVIIFVAMAACVVFPCCYGCLCHQSRYQSSLHCHPMLLNPPPSSPHVAVAAYVITPASSLITPRCYGRLCHHPPLLLPPVSSPVVAVSSPLMSACVVTQRCYSSLPQHPTLLWQPALSPHVAMDASLNTPRYYGR